MRSNINRTSVAWGASVGWSASVIVFCRSGGRANASSLALTPAGAERTEDGDELSVDRSQRSGGDVAVAFLLPDPRSWMWAEDLQADLLDRVGVVARVWLSRVQFDPA
jgi:hypothetical protein